MKPGAWRGRWSAGTTRPSVLHCASRLRTMSTTIASLNAARPRRRDPPRVQDGRAPRRPRRAPLAGRASVVTTRAAVDASVAYAVAQQDLFFAAVVAGECLYQQGNLPADFKGRPSLTDLPVPCGMLVGSFALIQTDQPLLSPAGLLLGAAACAAAGKYFLDRYDAIDDDGMDWPGPRIFPGTGLLFSLFVLLADLEAAPIMDGY